MRALWRRGRWRIIAIAALILLLVGGTFAAFQTLARSAEPCVPLGGWMSLGPTGNVGLSGFGPPLVRVGPTGWVEPGVEVRAPIDVDFNRSGATLDSVDVHVSPHLGDRDIAVYVLHREPGCSSEYYVVYQSRFRNTDPPSAWDPRRGKTWYGSTYPYFGSRGPAPPLSAWSGELIPRTWSDGCQTGDYEIYVAMPIRLGPFRSGVGDIASYATDDFRCRA